MDINPTEQELEQEARETQAADLERVRELVLRAHPDVVPELVAGDSVDALLASVEPARAAYQRIAERVKEAGAGTPPSVPAGQPGRQAHGAAIEDLSPGAKIAEGLRRRAQRG